MGIFLDLRLVKQSISSVTENRNRLVDPLGSIPRSFPATYHQIDLIALNMAKGMRGLMEMEPEEVSSGRCYKKLIELHPGLFKDDSLNVGGVVKSSGQVLNEHSISICRPPNISCRIQSFGRICQKFDEKRTRWVTEMGFGGLLHFVSGMHLPRKLAYWVMTRIDPLNKSFIAPDGRVFPFSKNQVRWILGIPSGVRQYRVQK